MINFRIKHPWTALIIIVVIAALLSNYGVVEGASYLFCLFAGIVIYKFVTGRN